MQFFFFLNEKLIEPIPSRAFAESEKKQEAKYFEMRWANKIYICVTQNHDRIYLLETKLKSRAPTSKQQLKTAAVTA